MKAKDKEFDLTAGREELNHLSRQWSAVLRTAIFEERGEVGVACLYHFDARGQRVALGPNAQAAARKAIVDVATLLAAGETPLPQPLPSPEGLGGRDEDAERFQSKTRNLTIGVTMPSALKIRLAMLAAEQDESLAEILRRLAAFGFDDFEQRSLFINTRTIFQTLGMELQQWQGAKAEQVMMRLEPDYVVRLKAAAREHQMSASEMGALCVAHGLAMSNELEALDAKVKDFQGPAVRELAEQIGLDRSAGRLLSGVLEGTTRAPRALLSRLASVLSAPESLLATYFRRSFDTRVVPSFKSEHGKPTVHTSSTRWEAAVKAGGFTPEQTKSLLQLGA